MLMAENQSHKKGPDNMAGYFTESNYENAVLQLINEELGYTYD